MARHIFGIVALVALSGMAFSGGAKPRWIKLKQAQAAAAQNGMPVCVYATVTADGSGC